MFKLNRSIWLILIALSFCFLVVVQHLLYSYKVANLSRSILGLAVIAAKADLQYRSADEEQSHSQNMLIISLYREINAMPDSFIKDLRAESNTIGEHIDYILDLGQKLEDEIYRAD